MAVVKNKSTHENQEFWSHVEAVAKQAPVVQGWGCPASENRTAEITRDQNAADQSPSPNLIEDSQ